jgi:hypothetical protein
LKWKKFCDVAGKIDLYKITFLGLGGEKIMLENGGEGKFSRQLFFKTYINQKIIILTCYIISNRIP